MKQLEQFGLKLLEEERRQFIRWLDDHRHEILLEEDDLSEGAKREILPRRAESRASPGLTQPVDKHYFERMKRRVADALAGKASVV